MSKKTCERGVVEISYRDKSYKGEVPIADAAKEIAEKIKTIMDGYKV